MQTNVIQEQSYHAYVECFQQITPRNRRARSTRLPVGDGRRHQMAIEIGLGEWIEFNLGFHVHLRREGVSSQGCNVVDQ